MSISPWQRYIFAFSHKTRNKKSKLFSLNRLFLALEKIMYPSSSDGIPFPKVCKLEIFIIFLAKYSLS